MPNLPDPILAVLSIFLPLFSKPTYLNFLTLFQGYVLCKGRRTISSALRMLSLSNIKNYSKFHDLFRRAKWSSLEGSKLLLLRLIPLCENSVTFSIDATIERRKGPKIKGLGIQRDPVRSTKSRKVLVPGLNWLVCGVHITFPWSQKPWALPFLTISMPPAEPLSSSKNNSDLTKKTRHKTQTKWACQTAMLLSRWVGRSKKITLVGDSGFATYELANTCIDVGIELVSRMRADARTFNFPDPPKGKKGRTKVVGNRLPTFAQMLKNPPSNWETITVSWYGKSTKTLEVMTGTCLWYGYGIRRVPIKWVLIRDLDKNGQPVVLFSTNLEASPIEIIEKFVNRWQLEVTFEEARRHLGMETQRQWADKSISRTTPCILAMYSIINLIAFEYHKLGDSITIQTSSWYKKDHVTFSDIMTDLRARILRRKYFLGFEKNTDLLEKELQNILDLLAAA